MLADIELIILPYSNEKGRNVLLLLLEEFSSNQWRRFQAAIAFGKQSGNFKEVLDAMLNFAQRGGNIEMTFGADTFGGEGRGSEFEAIEILLSHLEENPNVRIFLYHEKHRTFHPKLYLFSNEQQALLIIGSSNWSAGGLFDNIEANVAIKLDLTQAEHKECYDNLQTLFTKYWQEAE